MSKVNWKEVRSILVFAFFTFIFIIVSARLIHLSGNCRFGEVLTPFSTLTLDDYKFERSGDTAKVTSPDGTINIFTFEKNTVHSHINFGDHARLVVEKYEFLPPYFPVLDMCLRLP